MSDKVKTVDQFIATAKAETGEVWMDNHDWQHLIEMVEGLQAELQQAREALKTADYKITTILRLALSGYEDDYKYTAPDGRKYTQWQKVVRDIHAALLLPTPPDQDANG